MAAPTLHMSNYALRYKREAHVCFASRTQSFAVLTTYNSPHCRLHSISFRPFSTRTAAPMHCGAVTTKYRFATNAAVPINTAFFHTDFHSYRIQNRPSFANQFTFGLFCVVCSVGRFQLVLSEWWWHG